MTVVVLQVFVSLMLVAGSLVLFVHTVRQRDFDHADRLALAPLNDDTAPTPPKPTPRSETDPPCEQD
jgi:nitrogen fixation-related uncharacterized protein